MIEFTKIFTEKRGRERRKSSKEEWEEVSVKLVLNFIKYRTIILFGDGGIVPRILNSNTAWR